MDNIATLPDFELTKDQNNAFDRVKEFLKDPDKNTFILDGPAGTGKTTLLHKLKDELPTNLVICAPTNKATAVLRNKGFRKATTLDRVLNKSLYAPIHRPPTEEEVKFFEDTGQKVPSIIEEEAYEKMPADTSATVVALDEASMTNEEQINRLNEMYKKVITVGDAFQLPPVEGVKWFQTATPDVQLTEIVRTSAGSEINILANMIRRGRPEWKKTNWKAEVLVISKNDRKLCDQAFLTADQVLAHKNDTCDDKNFAIRDLRELINEDDCWKPVKGDVLLAWQTIKDTGIYKSETYPVIKSFPLNGGYRVLLGNTRGKYVDVSKATLEKQKSEIVNPDFYRFSFGHCITGHKSQGSEWDHVVVLANDHWSQFPEHLNWLYTCVTRAKKRLTVIV